MTKDEWAISILAAVMLIGLILAVLKLQGLVTASWWLVLTPIYGPLILVACVALWLGVALYWWKP